MIPEEMLVALINGYMDEEDVEEELDDYGMDLDDLE